MTGADHPEILLVEDNPSDAELTRRALNKYHLDHCLMVLKDGAEALDFIFCSGLYENRASGYRPKIILLDLKLPKINGMEVLQKIKSDERTRAIPVVVFTSSKEERDISESYRLGANSYIVKPVEFDRFVKAIGEIGLYWLVLNQGPR